jgi:asparagine synthase (glutamine-hydrolysing)
VKIRLVSEVPLGAFLSGGIDSATVVALMAKVQSDPVNTCGIGFREDQFNELPYARLVASRHKTNHHEYVVDPQIIEVLEKLSWHFDEPFADASAVPTYYVSKMARESVTVALSGDGGDENFAGYRRYYFDRLENRLRAWIPKWLNPTVRTAACLYPKADWLPRPFRAKTLLNNLSLTPVEGYFNSVSSIGDAVKQRLYSRDYLTVLNGHERAIDLFRGYFQKATNADPLSTIQYVDIKTYLVDDICAKVDRASMASSLEVRSPFLDHRLVEFAATVPWQLKLRGRTGKYILKETVKPFLPEEVLQRPKMGFSIPVRQWLRRDLSGFCREHLESLGRRRPDLFDVGFMRRLHSEHDSGLRDHSTLLWSLLSFELWDRRFMSPAARLP